MVMPIIAASPLPQTSRSTATVIVLSPDDEAVLAARMRAARTERRDLLRARIIRGAGAGLANAVIADSLGVHVDTVRKWRDR